MEQFRHKIPLEDDKCTVVAIEPSAICWIHKKDLKSIIEETKNIRVLWGLFIDALFERTFDYMKHLVSFIKRTPQERYFNLIRERPQIVQRIPQHHIPSFLAIVKVHLSRIKSKLLKEK